MTESLYLILSVTVKFALIFWSSFSVSRSAGVPVSIFYPIILYVVTRFCMISVSDVWSPHFALHVAWFSKKLWPMSSCEINESASGFFSVMGIPAFLKPYIKWEYLNREELAGFDRYKVGAVSFGHVLKPIVAFAAWLAINMSCFLFLYSTSQSIIRQSPTI